MRRCVGLIGKRLIKIFPCHPELATPLVADVKEAYKGGGSQSISGSSHRQKCATICTVSGKKVLDKVGWAFSPTMKLCWGRNHNLQKAISYASRKATRHVRGDLVPVFTLEEVFSRYHQPPRRIAFTLAEFFSPYYLSPRRIAFTLAEVLITLGIIGVVAALTLPGLIAKYQEKVWLNQFKVTYTTLSQAYTRAFMEYGSPANWDLKENDKDSNEKIYQYLSKYLKGQDYGFGYTSDIPSNYVDLNGEALTAGWSGQQGKHKVFALANGAIISITSYSYYTELEGERPLIHLNVDINGVKGPNQIGKDFFFLYLSTKKGTPMVRGYDIWWINQNYCTTRKGISGWWSGGGCAIWVIAKGNMDYLHRNITEEEWKSIDRSS